MDCIEKAKKDYPNLKINLISGANFNEMIQLLESHKIDFMIDATQVDTNYNNIEVKEGKTQKITVTKDEYKYI